MKSRLFVLTLIMSALCFASCKDEKSSEKEIISFSIRNVEGKINGTEITLTLPAQVDLSKLVAVVTVSSHASVFPPSGETYNFKIPVEYTVTAEDGTMKVYTVRVVKSTGTVIESFVFAGFDPEIEADIDHDTKAITAVLPLGTDLTSLVPVVSLSSGNASVSPASGWIQDFTRPVDYTVTDDDGNILVYTVTVKTELPGDKFIRSFTFGNFDPAVSGVIDEGKKTIVVTVPSGNLILAPVISIPSKATVSPASGVTRDFSKPVEYIVTAYDHSYVKYTVIVHIRD